MSLGLCRLVVALLLGVPTLAVGQAEAFKADSLRERLGGAPDPEKVSILIALSQLHYDTPKGLEYAQEALRMARRGDAPEATISALNNLGEIHFLQYQEADALRAYFESLELSRRAGQTGTTIQTLRFISRTFRSIDSLEQSLLHAREAHGLAAGEGDPLLLGRALADLAAVQWQLGARDSAVAQFHQALSILGQGGFHAEQADVYNQLGDLYYSSGNFARAIECYNNVIKSHRAQNDLAGLMRASYNLGNTHLSLGNHQLALEHFQESLRLAEALGHQAVIARSSSGIGQVYENLSWSVLAIEENRTNYLKALEFHEQALQIFQTLGQRELVGYALNNIANVYSKLTENQFVARYGEMWEDSLHQLAPGEIMASFAQAVDNYQQAHAIFTATQNQAVIAGVNLNLGRIHGLSRNWAVARDHLSRSLAIARSINSPFHIALSHLNLGIINYRQGHLPQAQESLLESASISEAIGAKEILKHSYHFIAYAYQQQQEYRLALHYHRRSVLVKDEIFTEKSQKAITEMQTKYETEQKEQAIKLLNNEKALQHSVIQRQKLTILIAIVGLIMILGFAMLLLRLFQNKRRANRILEEKNELISHQKQEITDSIRYASRIQSAVLPSAPLLEELLPDHFVLFLPRDIVSGDFYWVTRREGRVVIAAADCTGHGVPGAFMSMLGMSFLYEVVNKEGVLQPALILDTIRGHIKHTLSQTGKLNEQKDGMDISLCVLDTHSLQLEWAGAYNPLVLIRQGEMMEYKADKMPVAIHINDHHPFTNHRIALERGDTFYMYSDGYPDQFGGQEGRKFMSKRFKQLLLDVHPLPMPQQKELLLQAHLDWKGSYPQIDDIIVFGVKV